MIKEVSLRRFKKFKENDIELNPNSLSLLVGGNNSGKSSLLHAIAVWEFCKLILSIEKGEKSLFKDSHCKGQGLSADEFLPVAVPSLRHLWTNLITQVREETGGYNLRIGCKWDTEIKKDCYLEFGLTLANDRLFIKTTNSNIDKSDKIPTVAYLPPFAGIVDKEGMLSPVERRRLIGKGMSGSILRNLILDMYINNQEKRKEMTRKVGGKNRIKDSDRSKLRKNDPYELLQKTLRDIFSCELKVGDFNELYHTCIKVEVDKVTLNGKKFKRIDGYNSRDVMVEGSGFLQWLSVYTLALNEDIDVLLLDEPDSHLHSSLQFVLLERLEEFSKMANKQILVATHSSEIIKNVEACKILFLNGQKNKYLSSDQQKVGLLSGLGTEYSPTINTLQVHKKLLFVENKSDADILQIWCNTLGYKWPRNLVIWPNQYNHKERKYLHIELQKELNDLKTISLRDRDDTHYNDVDEDLTYKPFKSYSNTDNIKFLTWKRRNIENYLLCTAAISRVTGKTEEEIIHFFSEKYSLSIPTNFTETRNDSLSLLDGKEIIVEGEESITKKFNCNKKEIVKKMEKNEICEDVKIVIKHIIKMCDPTYFENLSNYDE